MFFKYSNDWLDSIKKRRSAMQADSEMPSIYLSSPSTENNNNNNNNAPSVVKPQPLGGTNKTTPAPTPTQYPSFNNTTGTQPSGQKDEDYVRDIVNKHVGRVRSGVPTKQLTAPDFIKMVRNTGVYGNMSDADLTNYYQRSIAPAVQNGTYLNNVEAPKSINDAVRADAEAAGIKTAGNPFFDNYSQLQELQKDPARANTPYMRVIRDDAYKTGQNIDSYTPAGQDMAAYKSWYKQLPEHERTRHALAVAKDKPDAYNDYNEYRDRLITGSLNPVQTRTTKSPKAPESWMPTHNPDGTKSGNWNGDYEQYINQIIRDPVASAEWAKTYINDPNKAMDDFEQFRIDRPHNAEEKLWRSKQMAYDQANGMDLGDMTFNQYQQVRQEIPQAVTRPKGKGNYRIDNNWYNKAGEQIGHTDAYGNFVQDVKPRIAQPGQGTARIGDTWYDMNGNVIGHQDGDIYKPIQ